MSEMCIRDRGYYAGRGTQLAEDEIFISDGAKSDLANVLGLFDVDNTVLVPDPVYPTYVDDNVTDGRKIIYGRTSQENGFLGMPDDSVKADIIYICSPNTVSYTHLSMWILWNSMGMTVPTRLEITMATTRDTPTQPESRKASPQA